VLRDGAPIASVHGMHARENRGLGIVIPGLMHISMVAVDPKYWRQKMGSAMVEFALTRATDRGFRVVQLFTADANAGACRLYESFGFVAGEPETDDRGELVRLYRLTF
jgi:ribosomal protein S18 acetylase RimI-like enzyme